jgi:hypothetical protein
LVGAIHPIEIELEIVAQIAVTPGATALGNPEELGHLHGAVEQLEMIEQIEISQLPCTQHSKSRGCNQNSATPNLSQKFQESKTKSLSMQ